MPKLEKPLKASDFVGNEERKQWIGSHSRITYLGMRYADRCDGFAGSVTRRGRRRCNRRAQFRFTALKTSDAVSGLYCWTHLSDQINEVTGREKKMFESWARRHVPPWQPQWEEWVKQADLGPEEPE